MFGIVRMCISSALIRLQNLKKKVIKTPFRRTVPIYSFWIFNTMNIVSLSYSKRTFYGIIFILHDKFMTYFILQTDWRVHPHITGRSSQDKSVRCLRWWVEEPWVSLLNIIFCVYINRYCIFSTTSVIPPFTIKLDRDYKHRLIFFS